MNREIKFRQWINNSRHFHYWGIIKTGVFVSPMGEMGNDKRESTQFTGLKDKNGKDIYEGDILRAIYCKSFGKNNVFYKKDVIVKIEKGNYGEEFIYETIKEVKLAKDKQLAIEWDKYSEFLVIGNKFENPELLDAKGGLNE